jgi:hypothetical protein
MTRTLAAFALLLVAALPMRAAAQAPVSASAVAPTWDAWLGCWRAVGEEALGDGVVCVLPGDDATSVRIVTVEGGELAGETMLRADGIARAVDEGGCTGQESAYWSRDGRRVFVRTELDCNGVRRVSTGALAFVAENEWIDAQALAVGEQHAARSIRYRAIRAESTPQAVAALLPADRDLAREAARLRAAAPLQLDDVIEAAGVIAPPALEALLAARQQGFGLDARTLVRLEQAGVPTSVIDIMIALSYPRSFAVEQPRSAPPAYGGGAMLPYYGYNTDCYDVRYSDLRWRPDCAYMFRYSRYGYGSRYGMGYSPWGYDPYGWRYGQPVVVIVRPEPAPGAGTGSGGLVRGRGYTRDGGTQSSGTAAPRSGSGSSSAGAQGSSSPPAAAPATTSGSSGSSTGRTAKPRTSGGGDPEQ